VQWGVKGRRQEMKWQKWESSNVAEFLKQHQSELEKKILNAVLVCF
jgi:hypothetical protein